MDQYKGKGTGYAWDKKVKFMQVADLGSSSKISKFPQEQQGTLLCIFLYYLFLIISILLCLETKQAELSNN